MLPLTLDDRKRRKNQTKYTLICFLIVLVVSCKKAVEIPSPSFGMAENAVYTIDATAISVLTGIYASLNSSGQFQGNKSISLLTGLSSDELTLFAAVTNKQHIGYYNNLLTAVNQPVTGSELWAPLFNYVYKCNAAIEGITRSTSLTSLVKQQLQGEAKFMRAFFYFYLVNLFGDVPLALTIDPKDITVLARSPKVKVYEQIVKDLQDAKELLSADYLNETLLATTSERVRPTKWAAAALLARAYLFSGNWAKAETEATALINNTALFNLLPLNEVFLKNSREAIWQIQPTALYFNTQDARTFIIPATGPSVGANATNPVSLSKNLLNSFETGDQRAVYGNWVDTTIYKRTPSKWDTVAFVYKYKVNTINTDIDNSTGSQYMTEYFMVLRLAEQYLIRAEARAQQGDINGAQADLNEIRRRAFEMPQPTTAADKASLLTAIWHERQVELFCEWGHRWLDLKRTGSVDAVMSVVTPQKANGASWQSYQQSYPIPLNDIKKAPNLVQNPGY